jgi:SAM-dependent methyltransferase
VQALHWMEPASTFREAVRILRPGGIFAACDYEWPPCVGSAAAEAAFQATAAKARRIEDARGLSAGLNHWDKAGHLARMKESGCFGFAREVTLSHADTGDADRFIGLLLSQGFVQQVLRQGVTEAEFGLPEFRAAVTAALGPAPRPWHWSARLRLGVKNSF